MKWLEARLLARQEEGDASDLYRLATESAPTEDVASIQIEHAGYLTRQERYADAIQLFEAADVLNREEHAHRGYSRALYEADELSKLSLFLERLGERGTLAPWAVEFAAEVAFARQDYAEAETRLRDLVEKRPGHLRAAAKRAGALIELNRTDEAKLILDDLVSSAELPADLAIGVAQLLVRLGEDLKALNVAYSALQKSPGDAHIQLAYANIFLHRGDKDDPELRPDVVGPRTWVVLHAGSKHIKYHLVDSKTSPDVTRNELSPQDGFAIDRSVLKVFDRLRGGMTDVEPALRITAAFLRRLALEQSAPGLLERVAALSFETVSAGRPLASTMGRLLAHLKRTFALMPMQLDSLERQLKSFVSMKTLGRSPLI